MFCKHINVWNMPKECILVFEMDVQMEDTVFERQFTCCLCLLHATRRCQQLYTGCVEYRPVDSTQKKVSLYFSLYITPAEKSLTVFSSLTLVIRRLITGGLLNSSSRGLQQGDVVPEQHMIKSISQAFQHLKQIYVTACNRELNVYGDFALLRMTIQSFI